MPQVLPAHGRLQHSIADNLTQQWVKRIGLAAVVGLGYFLAAAFSVRLVLEPEGVAVFWPAAGLSSGLLIVLGPRARWPVLAGVIVATVATHLIIKDPLWAGFGLGLCNGAEALITAGLIQHYFGADFNISRLRNVIGLFAAAVAGTSVSGIGGAVTYRLLRGPTAAILETWQHWFASDAIGIIAVAPLVIGVAAVVRRPSTRSEVIEGMLAIAVYGNRSQLQEVVSNLLVNALEAMATTSDRNRVLHVRTELRGDNTAAVLVQDSGPGIDKDRLGGIFTAFVSTKPHGMGLGLAICRMIIDYHGGKLIALSDGKDGASFEFVLPIASVDQDSARAV
jgi:hypothetical protein